MKTLTLKHGAMPALGLGTWKSAPGEVYTAVRTAIELGYRHFDCAAIYGNEAEIGKAFADAFAAGEVAREDLFVTSKLWNNKHFPADVGPALEKTLGDLRLDYLDLYLIHWPIAFRPNTVFPRVREGFLTLEEAPLEATWEAMLAQRERGLSRDVGVSNMAQQRLTELRERVGEFPAVTQVESHPYLAQNDLLEFCNANGIVMTAYSPLGSRDRQGRPEDEPSMLEDPTIVEIAETHGVGAGQVLLAWAVVRGTSVIPKSVNPTRLKGNLEAASLALSDDEMARIHALDRHFRFLDGGIFVGPHSPYTLEEIWR